jgi:hypothetical protein
VSLSFCSSSAQTDTPSTSYALLSTASSRLVDLFHPLDQVIPPVHAVAEGNIELIQERIRLVCVVSHLPRTVYTRDEAVGSRFWWYEWTEVHQTWRRMMCTSDGRVRP